MQVGLSAVYYYSQQIKTNATTMLYVRKIDIGILYHILVCECAWQTSQVFLMQIIVLAIE